MCTTGRAGAKVSPRLAAAVSFVVERVRADVGPVAGLPSATTRASQ